MQVRLRAGLSVNAALARLRRNDAVARAEPNLLFDLGQTTPNDPLFSEQWGFLNSGQEHAITDPPPDTTSGLAGADADVVEAWDSTQGSSDVVVAIIDSGVDLTHPDLQGNLWINPGETANGVDDDGNGLVDDINGFDFFDGDADPQDLQGHGTHVAGIVAAVAGNATGVAGVCPECRLMALRVGNNKLSNLAILDAIAYARSMGADIMNLSFSGSFWSKFERKAIARAGAEGVLTIAAAGNEDRDNDRLLWEDGDRIGPTYPASYDLPSIVSVAASNDHDQYAYATDCYYENGEDATGCYFTNWGIESVDLAAPGVDIVSTYPGGLFLVDDGTSMASPFVAGVAGLIKAEHPTFAPEQIRGALINSVDLPQELSGFWTLTDGRVDANAALNASPNLSTTPSDGSISGARSIGERKVARLNAITDGNDVYEKRLTKGTRYSVQLDVPSGTDFDVYVWKPGTLDIWQVDGGCGFSCALADAGELGRGMDEHVIFKARSAGTYYFLVSAVDGEGRYVLSVGSP